MVKWGFAAYSVYGGSSYNSLFTQNWFEHHSVEGNNDEWNEMWAWTFGYSAAANFWKKGSINSSTTSIEADKLLQKSYQYYFNSNFWDLRSPYRGDDDFIEEKDQDGWGTKAKRGTILFIFNIK